MSSNVEEFHRWALAWSAAMAEDGYPDAYLTRCGNSYSWTVGTVDSLLRVGVWDAAHRAFLVVDRARPSWVEPSPKLASMLNASPNDGSRP